MATHTLSAGPGLPVAKDTGPVVVVTGWRDTDRVRWLPTLSSAWAEPTGNDRPVVCAGAPPGYPTLSEVLRDLMFALGKSPHVTGGTKTNDGHLDAPAAWLLARNTREIIINDAGQLPPTVLRQLVELAVGVGARIWLIGHHHRTDTLQDIADEWDAADWTLEQFDLAWDRPSEPADRQLLHPTVARRCGLPATSALSFLSDCRRLLPAERFETLYADFRGQLLAAREHFTERQAQGKLDHEAVATLLRRQARAATDTDAVVVTVRAIEAAALPFGFVVDVDLPVLINASERNPRPARHTLSDAAALDAYTRPAYAAACALAMCEIPPEALVELTISDVAADGSTATTSQGVTVIPPVLRTYLIAQLLMRRFAGAEDTDAYLLTERDRPIALHWATRTIKLAEVECGVRLARPRCDRKWITTFEWLTVHGIAVRSLDDRTTRRQRS